MATDPATMTAAAIDADLTVEDRLARIEAVLLNKFGVSFANPDAAAAENTSVGVMSPGPLNVNPPDPPAAPAEPPVAPVEPPPAEPVPPPTDPSTTDPAAAPAEPAVPDAEDAVETPEPAA